MAKKEVQPWEQLDTETGEAFANFKVYRDMDFRRSLSKVAKETEISESTIQHHSSRNNWVHRAKEYDRHLDRRFVETRDDLIIEMRRRQIKTMLSAQELVVDQITKHKKECEKFPGPVMPIQHIAKLAQIAHVDERTNMEVPDAIIKMESSGLDTDNFTEGELKKLLELIEIGSKKKDKKDS